MSIFFQGFLFCFGLIVSIGAQNAFLLRQGLLNNYPFWIASICFFGDIVLMGLGILGLGSILAQQPLFSFLLAVLGAIFLFNYGCRSFLAVFRGGEAMVAEKGQSASLKKIILLSLAVTFLNPQVYIDTVVIVGGIGSAFNFDQKILFLTGALLCSGLWFYGLAFGAKWLSPYFEKRRTWQILDSLTALIMFFIAISLTIYAFSLFNQIWA